jgi:hypothetical protein
MLRLGIEPGFGLDWNDLIGRTKQPQGGELSVSSPEPWTQKEVGLNPDARVGSVTRAFHPHNEATQAARQFLREQGLHVPDDDPVALYCCGRLRSAGTA